jgi:prepilin-type processing-associated H-X9-DG protein
MTQTGTSTEYTQQGFPWNNGGALRSFYNHLLPPNANGYVNGGTATNNVLGACVRPAGSYHSGGVNVAFCDGSVHFVANYIDPDTWTAAGSIAGGETLELP